MFKIFVVTRYSESKFGYGQANHVAISVALRTDILEFETQKEADFAWERLEQSRMLTGSSAVKLYNTLEA